MNLYRKQDLSVLQWVKDLFTDVPYVSIVDGFPAEEFDLPIIAVDTRSLEGGRAFELGNSKGLVPRLWIVDVYAKNKSQRDEYGYRIIDAIRDNESKINVLDFDEGFPPDADPTRLGCLHVTNFRMDWLNPYPVISPLYYRTKITITAVYDKL